jgi:DNA transposition AAA+ family ATPase
MKQTNTERQAAFKARMYAAGYKQKQVWVLREDPAPCGGAVTDRNGFIRKLDELTAGWDKAKQSKLFEKLVKTIELEKGADMKK